MARKKDMRERVNDIETRARRLAQSGQYENFSSIEMVLLAQGYPEAAIVFESPGHNRRWTAVRTGTTFRARLNDRTIADSVYILGLAIQCGGSRR